jgi:transposase-like protein
MAARSSIDVGALLGKQLESASPDLLRELIKTMADALMSADADSACGADYGQRSPERVNVRNGYRVREWDTRAGTVELAIPKLREGSYYPEWLLEHRRRAEQALVSVVATSYLLGVSTRRVEKLVEQLGVTRLSKSQVSEMAKSLDSQVAAWRSRPLDAGPYIFVWLDALTQKVRKAGRSQIVHALIAVGVNADGQREVLGLDVVGAEDRAGWLAFLRGLVAHGLSGVSLVIFDAHPGLVDAIGAALPGACWQRCRTHYARNLSSQVPKTAQPWVLTLLWQRGREGHPVVPGEFIQHSDAGSQYTSIRFTEHRELEQIQPSIGSVGDAYDNALMETINGLYKAECIRTGVFHAGPFRTIADIEYATAGWVDWYNNRRLHSRLGMVPPVEYETAYYADRNPAVSTV